MSDNDNKHEYRPGGPDARGSTTNERISSYKNNPQLAISAYCLSSISMTMVNKYVVSGSNWNMTFFYLTVQVRYHTIMIKGSS